MKTKLLLFLLLLFAQPSYAWVNQEDINWQKTEYNLSKYEDVIKQEDYNPDESAKILKDALKFLSKADVDTETKTLLTGYFCYMISKDLKRSGHKIKAAYILKMAKICKIANHDGTLNEENAEKMMTLVQTPKP